MKSLTAQQRNKTQGFTLIELMIATALFVIVAIIALSAILSSNITYKKSEDMRALTDNLSFTMDDMSRNIKLGYNYYCFDNAAPADGQAGYDCEYDSDIQKAPTPSMAFVPYGVDGATASAADMQGYILCEDTDGTMVSNGDGTSSPAGAMYKIISDVNSANCSDVAVSGSNLVRLTDPRVHLNYERSGFYVANTASGDYKQPFVTMVLVGETVTKDIVTPFAIQTSVTQRQFGK